jgi:hypothetical protein
MIFTSQYGNSIETIRFNQLELQLIIQAGLDHNSGHPSNQPRYLTRNRLIAQALHRLILQLRLVLAGFMIKAFKLSHRFKLKNP